MEITWIAILASLCMGVGAALVFVFAVKKNYFRNIEDAKYHVFWSDLEEVVNSEEQKHGTHPAEDRDGRSRRADHAT